MAYSAAVVSFGDVNHYCKLAVFGYLDFKDRVRFERVQSQWKDLIRGSMTHLDLRFINNVTETYYYSKLTARIDAIAPQITQLAISDRPSNASVIKKFANLTRLTIADLTRNGALTKLSIHEMFKLKVFEMHISSGDKGFFDVQHVTGLTSLVSKSGLDHLYSMYDLIANNSSTLEKLELRTMSRLSKSLSDCSRLKKLRILHLETFTSTFDMQLLMKILKNNPELRDLEIGRIGIDDAYLKSILDSCSKLRRVVFRLESAKFDSWKRSKIVEPVLIEYSKQRPKCPIVVVLVVKLRQKKLHWYETRQIDNLTISLVSWAKYYADYPAF